MRKVIALLGAATAAGISVAAVRAEEQATPAQPEQVTPPRAARPRPALPP